MTPTALLDGLHANGITLSHDGNRLAASPKGSLTPELRASIAEHKAALLLILKAPKPRRCGACGSTVFWWRQAGPCGNWLCSWCHPDPWERGEAKL